MSKNMKAAVLLLFGLAVNAIAAGQTSANYIVRASSMNGGGLRTTSTSYSNDGSISGFGGPATTGNSQETDRTGYAGQLYEVTGLTVSAPSNSLNQGASMPLAALQFLDDATVTSVSSFADWFFTGPIIGVSQSGMITTSPSGQSGNAWVTAAYEGISSSLNLSLVALMAITSSLCSLCN